MAASNVVAKLSLADNGVPTVVSAPDGSNTRVLEIPVGKNPRGIVVNNADTRAYVMNFISRDVSVLDLSASPEKELAKVSVAALPPAGSDNFVTLLGNELFNTSVGTFDGGVSGRMSNNGWQACSSCHFEGLTDGVVWQFPAGPRKSIPLNASFSPKAPDTDQRVLNYSAIFDEVCDFEINIRNVSGGAGLIITDTVGSTAPHPVLAAFNPPNCGRKTLSAQGVNAWDAITQWVAKKVRSPQSPLHGVDPNSADGQLVAKGRQLFQSANCQLCHGGAKWSTTQVDFARTSPPSEPTSLEPAPVAQVAFLARFLRDVGTFNPSDPIEKLLPAIPAQRRLRDARLRAGEQKASGRRRQVGARQCRRPQGAGAVPDVHRRRHGTDQPVETCEGLPHGHVLSNGQHVLFHAARLVVGRAATAARRVDHRPAAPPPGAQRLSVVPDSRRDEPRLATRRRCPLGLASGLSRGCRLRS
ncbi:MAG: hypothetical protein E6J26_05710, partial [Chloroflexi bacterium]